MTTEPSPCIAHMTVRRHAGFRKAMTEARNKGGSKSLAMALGDFSNTGRISGDAAIDTDVANMPAEISAVVSAATSLLRGDLRMMRSLSNLDNAWKKADLHMEILVTRLSQILLALRLSGEDETLVTYVEGVLTRMAEETAFLFQISEEARSAGVRAADLAPAAYAAAVMDRPLPAAASASEALAMLGKGLPEAPGGKKMAQCAERLLVRIRSSDATVSEAVARHSEAQRKALSRDGVEAGRPVRFHSRLGEPEKSDVDIKVAVGFLASGRGGGDEARLEGAVDLLRDISLIESSRATSAGAQASLQRVLLALKRVSGVLREERSAHRKVEEVWRAVDAQMSRMPQKDGQARVFPIPRIEALDARAMYYQNAIINGLPLGVVLAELYDSSDLSFGDTEKTYFERVATYSARRYSADMAASFHPALETLDLPDAELEQARQAVRTIEIKVRRNAHLDDAQLIKMARDGISSMSGTDLRPKDAKRILARPMGGGAGLAEEMVLRTRAEEEVRLVTAHLAARGSIENEFIPSLHDLPHTMAFADTDEDGRHFWNITGRNGQNMYDINKDTKARWARYRQEAPPHRDVKAIKIPGADEIATFSPLALRAAGTKKEGPLKPFPTDDDELVARPRGPGR